MVGLVAHFLRYPPRRLPPGAHQVAGAWAARHRIGLATW